MGSVHSLLQGRRAPRPAVTAEAGAVQNADAAAEAARRLHAEHERRMAAAMVERAAAEAQLQLTYAKIKATDAELAVLRGKSSRFFRWTGVLVLGALALDYMWCEWEPLIKFRMRRRLESGEVGYPKPPPSLHLTVKPATLLPLLSSFSE